MKITARAIGLLLTFLCLNLSPFDRPAICQLLPADTQHESFSGTLQQLRLSLDSAMQQSPIPGAAVAVATADSVLFVWTSGLADKASNVAVTDQTLFCIGSCTKTFTGLGVLKLADAGMIDVNTPVRDIVPEIAIDNPWAETDPVRVIHLVEHTAGFDDAHTNWVYIDSIPKSLRRCLEEKANTRHVRWRPGTRYSYSSPGFTLAGYVIQTVAGVPYEIYVQRAMLEPIGMHDSRFESNRGDGASVATGYDRNIEPVPLWHDYDVPAGALNCSIRDMARFLRFMLREGRLDGSPFVSDSLYRRIARPQSTLAAAAGIEHGYSFGIGTGYKGGAIWHGHGGAVPGFLAGYRYCPERGIGFVVLQNQFGIMLHTDIYDVTRAALFGLADSIAPPPAASVSETRLRSYCGHYRSANPRMQIMGFVDAFTGGIDVLFERDTLFTRGFGEDPIPLVPVSDTRFRRPAQPEATYVFTEDTDGTPVLVSRSSYFERSSAWIAWLQRMLVFAAMGIMLSSLIYAVVWVPIHVLRNIHKAGRQSGYLSMRVVPLLAVVTLIAGVWPVGNQTLLEFGLPTVWNVVFYLSTLVFAGLSILSVLTAYRSLTKPVHMMAKAYALLLSLSCFGMTLYLGYWGVIGLKLWAY